MTYAEVKPHPVLEPYIDVYWTVESDGATVQKTKILPDGCIDIIINLEGDYKTDTGVILMKSETAYIAGTMTRYIENIVQSKTRLLGIRFRPAAFSVFYNFSSLHEFTDQHIEFEKALSPDIYQTIKHSTAYLNRFFINKLSKPKYSLMPVIASISACRGQINVRDLAQQHFTTPKQLERHFKYHIGTSPKEFSNLIRYQSTYDKIKNNTSNKSFLQIACESGYYDHAHLTNEIKKYTGISPSQI